jgi:putative transposase
MDGRPSFERSGRPYATSAAKRTARRTYQSRDEAKADVFEYIEHFYNPKRRHSTSGYVSPMESKM